jgi:hypothetical protein
VQTDGSVRPGLIEELVPRFTVIGEAASSGARGGSGVMLCVRSGTAADLASGILFFRGTRRFIVTIR